MPTLNSAVLRRECEARDLTLTQVARLAGLRRETLSRAMAGHRVTEQTLQRIAAVLRRVPVLERDPITARLVADPGTTDAGTTKARAGSPARARRTHGAVDHTPV